MFGKTFFSIVAVLNLRVHATNSESALQKFMDIVTVCAKDFPMSSEDIEQLKNRQLPDNENMKCLFSCVYKAVGIMDDEGKLSLEGVNNHAQTYLSHDTEQLARAKEFAEACMTVNDAEVSDGKKGCERAALIFKCSVEKAPQFGFGL